MARASLMQHAFNGGEFSPLMLGRQDIEQYAKSLYTCFNAQPLTQGGWTRRSGSLFLWPTRNSGGATSRLAPFKYSLSQAYLLEISNGVIRFFANHGLLVQTAVNITDITQANPAVITYSGTNPANGDRHIISGVAGMTQMNNREVVVTNVNTTAKTYQAYDVSGTAINSTGFAAYTSGGTYQQIVELLCPYQTADLPDIRWTQSASTLYLFHPNYPPQALTRTSALAFTIGAVVFTDGPYDVDNDPNTTGSTSGLTTLTASATTGSAITITASAVTGINGGSGFLSTDVGRLVRIGSVSSSSASWGYAQITAVGSTTSVTATVLSALPGTTAYTHWRLGLWSNTTGYPRCGCFFQNRLVMAGAANYPQRFDASVSSEYANFAPSATDGTVTDSNAIGFNVFSNDVNNIQWMANHALGLVLGTESSNWLVTPSSTGGALTPTNVNAQIANSFGSAAIDPYLIDRSLLFVERGNRRLRELSYVITANGFEAPDMSLLAPHVTETGVQEMVFQIEPQPILWFTRGDGVLVGFTYLRDNNVTGWHRHELGGVSTGGGIALVEHIAVLPSPDTSTDEVYVVVQRQINGKTVRYIELLTKIWEDGDDQTIALFGDSGALVSFGNSPGTVLTGLNWLEGQKVGVLADGCAHPDLTITNGSATLDVNATTVSLGLKYTSIGETMPVEGGGRDGPAQGKLKRIFRYGMWIIDTLGLFVGTDASNNTEILERTWGSLFGNMVPLFTGVVRDYFPGDWDRLGQVYWQANGMFPATVLALMTQLDVEDQT